MAQLSTKIKLYCEANGVSNVDFMKDVMLQDDMVDNISNPYIKEWNLDIAQPTDAQLSAQESAADTEEANNVVRSTRRTAYGDIGEQLDEIYKDIDAWKARIKSIKDANPKS
jgi:exosome complex RNA-binding protein Rrp4